MILLLITLVYCIRDDKEITNSPTDTSLQSTREVALNCDDPTCGGDTLDFWPEPIVDAPSLGPLPPKSYTPTPAFSGHPSTHTPAPLQSDSVSPASNLTLPRCENCGGDYRWMYSESPPKIQILQIVAGQLGLETDGTVTDLLRRIMNSSFGVCTHELPGPPPM